LERNSEPRSLGGTTLVVNMMIGVTTTDRKTDTGRICASFFFQHTDLCRFSSDYSDKPKPERSNTLGEKPARPTAPKPVFTRKDSLGRDQYIAQFTFEGEQSGDLSFKKGEIIEVIKSSGSRNVLPSYSPPVMHRTGGQARSVTEQGYFQL